MKNNPIIIVDDDADDLELLNTAFGELNVEHEIIIFNNSLEAFDFITSTTKKPFVILCDINMPLISGLELRKKIYNDEKLRVKSIPFLFLSTTKASPSVEAAYNLSAQGYFEKPNTMDKIKEMLECIIKYWGYCQHPNSQFDPYYE